MNASSQNRLATSRQIESQLLNALAEAGQSHVAASIGVDESTISKWKGGEYFLTMAKLMIAMGLKPVAANAQVAGAGDMVVNPSELGALKTLALKYLEAGKAAE